MITQQRCFYCGDLPKERKRKWKYGNGYYIYNGLDRFDNNKGYTKENIVPCCKDCNMAKKNMLANNFIDMAIKIAKNHKEDLNVKKEN